MGGFPLPETEGHTSTLALPDQEHRPELAPFENIIKPMLIKPPPLTHTAKNCEDL